MNGQRYRETPLDIERLRRLNRATVERYMAMKGAERLQRHSLFVEDGCAGNWTTESGEPLVFRGHESLRRLAEWLERCFPDWEWHNVRIFETEDPNHFWVECDGRGKALVPGQCHQPKLQPCPRQAPRSSQPPWPSGDDQASAAQSGGLAGLAV
ncbi:phenazine biosynthesis protein, partial [Pseudomonas aeruginosa]|uniref:phenazine biosynthesis protein n=1 Tax=Pseudomonas aeruginosa TaxID=287 RepID=UPI0021AB20C7